MEQKEGIMKFLLYLGGLILKLIGYRRTQPPSLGDQIVREDRKEKKTWAETLKELEDEKEKLQEKAQAAYAYYETHPLRDNYIKYIELLGAVVSKAVEIKRHHTGHH